MVGDGAGVEEFCGLLIAHVLYIYLFLRSICRKQIHRVRLVCPSDGCSLVPFEKSYALQLQFAAQNFASKAFFFEINEWINWG